MFSRHVLVALGSLALLAACANEVDDLVAAGPIKVAVVHQASSQSASPVLRTTQAGFAAAPDRGRLMVYPDRTLRRDGAYTWRRVDLSEEHALKAIALGRLSVTTPSGETLQFKHRRHIEHASGDWSWVGELEGGPRGEETILTFGEKAAFGTIAQPGREPLRLTMRDGASWVVETDRALLRTIDNAATRPTRPDYMVPPKLAQPRSTGASVSSSEGAKSVDTATAASSAANVVDLVLGYTSGFAAGLGGQSQALTRLNHLVMVSNQSFANGMVDAEVRLVRAVEVNYPDATKNGTALEELTGFRAPSTRTTPAAVFAELRAARDQYGGDLVSLVRKFNDPENEGCGIAWLIGGNRRGIDRSDEFFGYSIVSDGTDAGNDGKTYFCRDETLAHELGHNMGSQHDRATATVDGTLKYGLHTYSFGHKTTADEGNFFTVMAYGERGQTRYRTFSNPRTTFCGGFACGVEDMADNARSLAQSVPVVATFRASVVAPPPPTPPPASARRPSADIDGDGRSDLLLQNQGLDQTAYWIMNGATPTRFSAAFTRPAGYTQVARGDFNGDGKLDIVWARSSDRNLVMWQGDGTGFTQLPIRDVSSGWAVTGAADVDGDGRSDLLLANAGSGQLAYWIMNGATPVRFSSAFMQPAGYTQVATGDFNGDGKADLVWARASDRNLVMWQGDGNGFTQLQVRDYSAGWTVTGAGDIDGDGKSDLLLANAGSGLVAYWIMNGATPARFSSAFVQPAGYTQVATGDYNGDGKLDLVWARGSDRSLLMWLGDGNGFAQFPIRNYSAGWEVGDATDATPGPTPVPTRRLTADIDGDGRSDLLLQNGGLDQTAYWIMNGATPTRFSVAFTQPAGYTRVATGDFNGDGKLDIVWARSSDRNLLMWLGDGSGFTQLPIRDAMPGWAVTGAADVDGDGKSDLLLANTGSGLVAYWTMNGATPVRFSSAFVQPAGYTQVATGDFNGDGKADLVWARASDRNLVMWQGDGNGFTQLQVRDYSPGWTVTGAGDIDGDGKSDLLVSNASQGISGYWIMNGAVPTRYSPVFTDPAGYARVATGDYNGDGKLDLVWARGSDRSLLMWLGDGSGFAVVPIRTYNEGWSVTHP